MGFLPLLLMVTVSIRAGAEGRLRSGDDKMVGGVTVRTTYSIPHVASLLIQGYNTQNDWSPVCGGSIIGKLFVLTACLCVTEEDGSGTLQTLDKRIPLDKWEFKAGVTHLFDDETFIQKRKPVDVQRHPSCHSRTMENNVAIAKMGEPFNVDDFVKPAKIYSWVRETFGDTIGGAVNSLFTEEPPCHVAGFGSNKQKSIEKVYVETPATTVRQTPSGDQWQIKKLGMYPFYEGLCVITLVQALEKDGTHHSATFFENLVNKYQEVYHNQFCALSKYKNESVCDGSAGTGLICRDFLVGLVSSYGACGAGDPILFLDLQTVLDWVRRHVCGLTTCAEARNIRPDCLPQHEIQAYINEHCSSERKNEISPKSSTTRKISSLWLVIILTKAVQ